MTSAIGIVILLLFSAIITSTPVNAFDTRNNHDIDITFLGTIATTLQFFRHFDPSPTLETTHQDMTKSALPFLKDDVITAINTGHEYADFVWANQNNPYLHFDSCNFYGASGQIRSAYYDVETSIVLGHLEGKEGAYEKFGEILHTAQDFYSHSNWIGLQNKHLIEPDTLVDSGFGQWTVMQPYALIKGTNIRVIEGTNQNLDVTREKGSHIVKVDDGSFGLITGVADSITEPDSTGNCPPSIALGHWDPYYTYDLTDPHYTSHPILQNIGTEKFAFLVPLSNDLIEPGGEAQRYADFFSFDSPQEGLDTKGLNKDTKDRNNSCGEPGNTDEHCHDKAIHMAKLQTTHEWCRLVNLLNKNYGKSVVEKLFDDWVEDRTLAESTCAYTTPIAQITGPTSVNEQTLVSIDGTGSSDAAGHSITYSWSQIEGPSVDFHNANSPTPSFVSPRTNIPVTLTLKLVVYNGMIESDPAFLNIQVTPSPGSTFVVNSNADRLDGGTCDSSDPLHPTNDCTLREAINAANSHPGKDDIYFNIEGPGTHSIKPLSPIQITEPIVLDATTQPGFSGKPIIEIDGSNLNRAIRPSATNDDGIELIAGDSLIRGLVINRFGGDGILIESKGNNVIQGNYIGTDISGTRALANRLHGISIRNSNNNLIGGEITFPATPATSFSCTNPCNLVSGNTVDGIMIDSKSAENTVFSNYIGTDVSGTKAIANGLNGIEVRDSAENHIGGNSTSERNLVSGNGQVGIFVSGSKAINNVIQGNYIGTDISGTTALGNEFGISIIKASNNTIGGLKVSDRNTISGNADTGIAIFYFTATNNTIQGNFIGTDVTGKSDLGNGNSGIGIVDSPENTVGPQNTISGNDKVGVAIINPSSTGNIVQGNFIGTDFSGTKRIGNNFGVQIQDAPSNIIGRFNIVSGNIQNGIGIIDSGNNEASNNIIEGNYIGTDIDGTYELGNGADGILLFSSENIVRGNTISSNDGNGMHIAGSQSSQNLVVSNAIGTSTSGTDTLGNKGSGVEIDDGKDNTIDSNIISGNDIDGVLVIGESAIDNSIANNLIGTDAVGSSPISNDANGIELQSSSNSVLANIVSGNNGDGILVFGEDANNNLIQGNIIGTDFFGSIAMGNSLNGIQLKDAEDTLVGGSTFQARNIISGNLGDGLLITGSKSQNNSIQGNYIGVAANATTSIGNLLNGIEVQSMKNKIGGQQRNQGNTISGNLKEGIFIVGISASQNIIQSNHIGANSFGNASSIGNGLDGIVIQDAPENIIGRTDAITPEFDANEQSCILGCNVIANNTQNGVTVMGNTATGNSIRGNSIYGNGALGIDLALDDITPNDSDDVDSGANNLNNFPILTAISYDGVITRINGVLMSPQPEQSIVDIFVSRDADPSGLGEGQQYLGSVIPSDSGEFHLDVSGKLPFSNVTAISTDSTGSTSEFSVACDVANGFPMDDITIVCGEVARPPAFNIGTTYGSDQNSNSNGDPFTDSGSLTDSTQVLGDPLLAASENNVYIYSARVGLLVSSDQGKHFQIIDSLKDIEFQFGSSVKKIIDIAASGEKTVYLIGIGDPGGCTFFAECYGSVFVMKSDDNGHTFSDPITIGDTGTNTYLRESMEKVSAVAQGDDLSVAWITDNSDIEFVKSSNAARSFESPIILKVYNDTFSDTIDQVSYIKDFDLAASGNSTYILVTNTRGTYIYGDEYKESGDAGIFLFASNDAGSDFEPAITINNRTYYNSTHGTFSSLFYSPRIGLSEGNEVIASWADQILTDTGGYYGGFIARSIDGGSTFSNPLDLGSSGLTLDSPQISAAGRNVYLSWLNPSTEQSSSTDPWDENFDIIFSRSLDEGVTFTKPAPFARTHGFFYPWGVKMATVSNYIYLAWRSGDGETYSLNFVRSIDNGTNFENISLPQPPPPSKDLPYGMSLPSGPNPHSSSHSSSNSGGGRNPPICVPSPCASSQGHNDDATSRITVYSPVNILVIDAEGRKTGFDSSINQEVNEIPDADFTGIGSEPQSVVLPYSIDLYTVKAFSLESLTEPAEYHLAAQTVLSNGTVIGESSVAGTAAPFGNYTYFANFDIDITTPSISVPKQIKSIAPAGDDLVPVVFHTAAFDNVDGSIIPVCDYPSGSTFPVGETIVHCTATDSSGNSASASFSVIVIQGNVRPTAFPQSVNTDENSALSITLTGQPTNPLHNLSFDIVDDAVDDAEFGSIIPINASAARILFMPGQSLSVTHSFDFVVTEHGSTGDIVSEPATVTITVHHANESPVAKAGPNQTVREGSTVTLDGSSSTDLDGEITSYAWQQTAGPSVTLSDSTAAQPTFTAPSVDADTTLTFQLIVTDDGAASAADTVDVLVKDVARNNSLLTLNPITAVPWGLNITVTGTLVNADNSSGIGGATINFTGTGASSLGSVITAPDGTFTATGAAPSAVGSGWKVKAHYDGDTNYDPSVSLAKAYNTKKHQVLLQLQSASKPWNQTTTFTVIAKDLSNGSSLVEGMNVNIDGTYVMGGNTGINMTTNAYGVATWTGTAPVCVCSGWTAQAHFAGDSLYAAKNSPIKTFSTLKHKTSLSLTVTATTTNGIYRVQGVLKDITMGQVLESQTITFTADSPISIADGTTNALGIYKVLHLAAPSIAGTYSIQAHFAGDSLYLSKDSNMKTLVVT